MEFLWGECNTRDEAWEFIHVKSFDGWKVMVEPYRMIDGDGMYIYDFLIYKFKDE